MRTAITVCTTAITINASEYRDEPQILVRWSFVDRNGKTSGLKSAATVADSATASSATAKGEYSPSRTCTAAPKDTTAAINQKVRSRHTLAPVRRVCGGDEDPLIPEQPRQQAQQQVLAFHQ